MDSKGPDSNIKKVDINYDFFPLEDNYEKYSEVK